MTCKTSVVRHKAQDIPSQCLTSFDQFYCFHQSRSRNFGFQWGSSWCWSFLVISWQWRVTARTELWRVQPRQKRGEEWEERQIVSLFSLYIISPGHHLTILQKTQTTVISSQRLYCVVLWGTINHFRYDCQQDYRVIWLTQTESSDPRGIQILSDLTFYLPPSALAWI